MKTSELVLKLSIRENVSIQNAVKVLNDGHKRIALVVSGEGKLQGVLADSDVRRALLAGHPMTSPVSAIMKANPVVARVGMSQGDILQLMVESHCFEIPVVDSNGYVTDLKIIQDLLSHRTETAATAIIMAGGMGRRLLPLTEKMPKPLVEVAGQPILFILLDGLIESGVGRIFIAINYMGQMIKDAVLAQERFRALVEFLEEETALGTAGALSLLPEDIQTPLILCNADLLTKVNLASMVRFHKSEKNSITVALREESFQVPFGVVRLNAHQILGIEEKPIQKFYVSAGIYVLDPAMIRHIPKDTTLDMPDLINMACDLKERVGSFPIFEYWKDIGEHTSLEQAQADFSALGRAQYSKEET